MNPMNTAPRDGRRILIKTKTMGWSSAYRRNVVTGDKWVEARWAKDLSGNERWLEWCGNPETHTTSDIVPLGWAPLPLDEADFTEETVPKPDSIVRYKDGSFVPLMFHYADEGIPLKQIAESNGFHLTSIAMEDDVADDHPAWIACFDEGRSDMLPLWRPEPPMGYSLVAKYFTEDGPIAIFIMRKSKV